MMVPDEFKFRLFRSKPLDKPEYADRLYSLLDAWKYKPVKFNDVEPLRNAWENRDVFIRQFLINSRSTFGTLMCKWSKPTLHLSVTWFRGPTSKCHSLSLFGASVKQFGNDALDLVGLADQLFGSFEFDYGFACLNSEYYHSNIYTDVQIDERTIQPVQVVGMEWPDCIPGLYWCNYFGKAYFEQGFGRRIADLPNTTKLANGIRLMRSDSALDWESPEDRERTQSLMETLGRDWFFTKETGIPDKALKTNKSLFLKPLPQ